MSPILYFWENDKTLLTLTSPAPVFDLKDPHTPWADAYWAFEGLLGRLHAAYHGADKAFAAEVLAADPRRLYCAMLHSLRSSVLNTPVPRRLESQRQQLVWAEHEIRRLEENGDWCHDVLESLPPKAGPAVRS